MVLKNKTLNWLAVFLWAGLIFFLSSQPSLPGVHANSFDFIFKKTAHMFVYAVLYFLIVRATEWKTKSGYLLIFCICFLYGSSDEFHQGFVAGRFPSIMDVGFDLLGASVAAMRQMKII